MLNLRFRRLFPFLQWELVYIYFTERKSLLILKEEEKMIGHQLYRTEFENNYVRVGASHIDET